MTPFRLRATISRMRRPLKGATITLTHSERCRVRQVILGKTGLSVSRLGLGTDILHAGDITLQDVTRIALRAWELGITLIDTDRWYDVYPALAEAISSMERSRLVLATKTYEKSREGAWNDIHYALDTLKVDYLDLFHLHAVDSMEQYGEMAGALEALQEAKAQGLIRHIGLSTHAVPVMQAMADHDEIEAILTVLNLTGKNMHAAARGRRWREPSSGPTRRGRASIS